MTCQKHKDKRRVLSSFEQMQLFEEKVLQALATRVTTVEVLSKALKLHIGVTARLLENLRKQGKVRESAYRKWSLISEESVEEPKENEVQETKKKIPRKMTSAEYSEVARMFAKSTITEIGAELERFSVSHQRDVQQLKQNCVRELRNIPTIYFAENALDLKKYQLGSMYGVTDHELYAKRTEKIERIIQIFEAFEVFVKLRQNPRKFSKIITSEVVMETLRLGLIHEKKQIWELFDAEAKRKTQRAQFKMRLRV